MLTWKNEKRKISDLIPADYNPRKLTEKSTKDLSTSLTRFNLADPLVINSNNRIIGGHQRLKILVEKGVKEVDVRSPSRELTLVEEKELNLRLNKNLGEWDFDLLSDFDEDLLKDVGFESSELDKIFQLDPEEKDDEIPQVKEDPTAKRGDVYQLGRHRIMCGDSTSASDVAILMDGNKADMVFTSPPYNLGVSAQLRGNTEVAKNKNVYNDHDDSLEKSQWLSLICDSTKNAIEFSDYVFINLQFLAGNRIGFWDYIYQFKEYLCDIAIWDKGHGAPAMAHRVMNNVFEMIFIFSKENQSRAIGKKDFRGTVENIFRITPQRSNEYADIHGASFPVQLPYQIINTFSNREGLIVDLFLGTGTTLIACEKTSRISYGMEIDPLYVDVSIKRWEDFTGEKAEKING